MRKFLLIFGIAIIGVVTLFCGFIYLITKDEVTGNDGVDDWYFENIWHIAILAKKFSNFWPFETDFEIFSSQNSNIQEFSIFYPKNLETENQKFPAIVMLNGTNTPVSLYKPILKHLASWGFIVIGNEEKTSGDGLGASKTLDFLLALNKNSEKFAGKIDTAKIGIFWHSQGGAGAINAVTKFENGKNFQAIYTASAISEKLADKLHKTYNVSEIKIPYFMMNSTGANDSFFITSLSELEKNFQKTSWPKIMGRMKNIDHKDVLEYGDSYATAWFLWILQNNNEAKKVFIWENPEILQNSWWQDVKIQNF